MSKAKRNAIILAVVFIVLGMAISLRAFRAAKWDFGKLGTISYHMQTYNVFDEFDDIDVDVHGSRVCIARSDNEQCWAECYEMDGMTYNVSVNDGVLTVTERDERRWYERIAIMSFSQPHIILYLPDSEYDMLKIKTTAGRIEVPTEFSFSSAALTNSSGSISFCADVSGELSAVSSSGSIRIESVHAGTLSAQTSSGGIAISEIDTESLTLIATSGGIKVDSVTVNGDTVLQANSGSVRMTNSHMQSLNVKTTSGSIRTSSVIVRGDAALQANSGSIKLERSDAQNLDIKATSGSVKATLMSGKDYHASANSGSVHVPASEIGAGRCEIHTSSGSIRVEEVN